MSKYKTGYHHQPLNPDGQEIRLLRLRPELSKDGLIQCDIAPVDLAAAPEYQALSYEWGPPKQIRRVSIAGRVLIIRENLWLFLDMFRSTVANNTLLWIDQICIDQQNLSERGHQVKLMGEIYTKAFRAVVWLGPSIGVYTDLRTTFDRHTVLVYEDLGRSRGREEYGQRRTVAGDEKHSMIARVKHYWHKPVCTDGRCTLCCWKIKHKALYGTDRDKVGEGVTMLIDPLELTYWTRLWIIQENVLARSCIFFLGNHQYSRCDLFNYASLLSREIPAPPFDTQLTAHIRGLLTPARSEIQLSLEQAFARFHCRTAKCSEPRDLVYGLLGLVHPTHRIPVDYSLTQMEVFGSLMDAIILSPTLKDARESTLIKTLKDLGVTLGITSPWNSWLNMSELSRSLETSLKDFLTCLEALELKGLQKTKWTSHELGSVVHTARLIEYKLLPMLEWVHSRSPSRQPLYAGYSEPIHLTQFIESINAITKLHLPALLQNIVSSAGARDPMAYFPSWDYFANIDRFDAC